jgi:hypothetical protein
MDALTPPSDSTLAKGTAEYRAKNRATAEVIPIEPKRAKKAAKKVSGWLAGALTLSPSLNTRNWVTSRRIAFSKQRRVG